jgi:hypothetical protein
VEKVLEKPAEPPREEPVLEAPPKTPRSGKARAARGKESEPAAEKPEQPSREADAADSTDFINALLLAEPAVPNSGEMEFSQPALRVEESAPVEKPSASGLGEGEVRQAWMDLVKTVRRKRPLISLWLESGVLLSVEGGQATLGFPMDQSLAEEYIQKENKRTFLSGALGEILGATVQLRCVRREGVTLSPVPQEAPPEAPASEPKRDPMEEFQDDPLIQKALDLFQARLESV